jgi:hypothetical protein
MKQSRYPAGWDEERVKRVLAHYEQQSDDEAVAEDEAGIAIARSVDRCRIVTCSAGL